MLIPTTETPSRQGMPCLVWAYAFARDGSAQTLDVDTLDAAGVWQARMQGQWVWLHFNTSDARTPQAVAQLDLPESASDTLLSHDTHVSLQLEGDTAFGVIVDWRHQRGTDPSLLSVACDDLEVGWLHFTVGQGLLVSARRHALHSVEQVRRHVAGGLRLDSEADLLEAIVDQFAASVGRATLELGDQLDRIEDRVLTDSIGEERRDLAVLRRRAVTLQRPLTALRRVLRQFEQRHAASSPHPLVAAASRLSDRKSVV